MAYMAIRTKFLGATNYRGARIKATVMDTDAFNGGRPVSVTIGALQLISQNGYSILAQPNTPVPWDYEGPAEPLHRKAAEALLPQLVAEPDNVRLISGGCGRGYVFLVLVPFLIVGPGNAHKLKRMGSRPVGDSLDAATKEPASCVQGFGASHLGPCRVYVDR